MAYESLKQEIRQYIKTNGQNEITGQILQDVLIDMVNQYPSLDGYATQQWVESQGYISEADLTNYATKDWVGQNFLTLDGGGMITNANDYGLSVAENGLRFYYNGSVAASLLVSNTPDGPVLDISSGTTIGGYTIWNSGNLNPSDYMLSSTAVINSVTGDELGHLTLTGPNFSATVLDFSHQHRWEELIDVPTNLRDLGITEEYLPLSAGQNNALTGDLYVGVNSIHLDYNTIAGSAYSNISHEKIVVGSTVNITNGEFNATINNDGTIQLHSYQDVLGEVVEYNTILGPHVITTGGNVTANAFVKAGGTAAQFLKADGSVDSNTYITANGSCYSATYATYATYDSQGRTIASEYWVEENFIQSLSLEGLTDVEISNLSSGQVLMYSSGGSWQNTSLTLDDVSDGLTRKLSNYMLSSTAVINSVVGDELGHLTLTGPNFSATVLDFSHQHRWEELIDVPTNLRDLGITEEYLPLSAGQNNALTGDLYVGANSIHLDYNTTAGSAYSNISHEKIVVGSTVNITNGEFNATINNDGTIQLHSYQDVLGEVVEYNTILGPHVITTGGNVTANAFVKAGGTSSQFLKADGTVDSNTYATQSTVNGLSYINGVALNGDGSLSLTGHSFTTTVLDMTHQHRWEELTDRPLIDMWNDTMVSVNGIVSSGRIGAGVSSTPSYMLEVNGQTMLYYEVGIGTAPTSGISLDIDGTARASSFVNNSDIRKKDVIEYDVDPGFETVANAPTIRFTWKDRGMLDNRVECVGSIAQYWQRALPEAVMTDGEGYLSMQYDVIALIAAVSVAKRVASHEQRIEALERENALLRMDIKALKGEA